MEYLRIFHQIDEVIICFFGGWVIYSNRCSLLYWLLWMCRFTAHQSCIFTSWTSWTHDPVVRRKVQVNLFLCVSCNGYTAAAGTRELCATVKLSTRNAGVNWSPNSVPGSALAARHCCALYKGRV